MRGVTAIVGGVSDTWEGVLSHVRQQQAFLDLFVRSWIGEYNTSGGVVHCGKGCAGCCSLVVNTSFAEALAIAGELRSEQQDAVREHVERLRLAVTGVENISHYLRMHRYEIGHCPLLDHDGACGIYARRPISCRSLLSTRESRWCSTDFATLVPSEKKEYIDSLDRRVVAFPLHYVRVIQESAQELEAELNRRMQQVCGFSIYGNLPVLLNLILEHDLAGNCILGKNFALGACMSACLDHPLLISFSD